MTGSIGPLSVKVCLFDPCGIHIPLMATDAKRSRADTSPLSRYSFLAAFSHLANGQALPGADTLRPDMKGIGLAISLQKGHFKVRLSGRAVRLGI